MTEQVSTTAKRARRRHGEGSLRERGAGHWELRAYSSELGRQVTRTYPGRGEAGVGRRDAQRALVEFIAEVDSGRYVAARQAQPVAAPAEPVGPDHTLAALLVAWLDQCQTRGREATTMRGYRLRADRYAASPLGTVPVDAITPEDIDRLHAAWVTGGMSHASVLHHFRVLRAAMRQGVRWRWLASTPTADATVTIPTRRRPKVIPVEDLEALVAGAPSRDLRDLIIVAAFTGARRGELAGLQWGDIDWPAQRITFRRSVYEFWEGGEHRLGVKGLKRGDEKTEAVDAVTLRVLAARREHAEADAVAVRSTLSPSSYVFSRDAAGGAPRGPDSITSAFDSLTRALARQTGDDRWHAYTFHGLRHWNASAQTAAGVDAITVAHRLGHADAGMVLRVYAHPLLERDRAAAEVLGQIAASVCGGLVGGSGN